VNAHARHADDEGNATQKKEHKMYNIREHLLMKRVSVALSIIIAITASSWMKVNVQFLGKSGLHDQTLISFPRSIEMHVGTRSHAPWTLCDNENLFETVDK
jgi:hypothetical protein